MMIKGSTWLVVNGASGSNDPAVVTDLCGLLTPERVFDVQSVPLPDRTALNEAGVRLLALFAGDGTVNAAVTGIEGWDGEVLVLPGGTANLLAKALHGERPALDIVRERATLRQVRRSCIRSAHGTALIELLAGPGATWSDVREGLREGDVQTIAATALDAVRRSATGPMVAITDPPIGREQGYVGVRLCLEENLMAVEGFHAETAANFLLQGVALLKRDFREGPHDELGRHKSVLCRSLGDAPIEMMIDGERRTGTREERFSLGELPVNLLASR